MKQYPNFKNVYVHDEGDKKVFCYRTGLCVYEEVLHRGCLASAGWNTAGYTLNVLDDMPTRLNADLFTEAAVLLFKEKLSKKQWIGIVLGILSVVFLCNPFS